LRRRRETKIITPKIATTRSEPRTSKATAQYGISVEAEEDVAGVLVGVTVDTSAATASSD